MLAVAHQDIGPEGFSAIFAPKARPQRWKAVSEAPVKVDGVDLLGVRMAGHAGSEGVIRVQNGLVDDAHLSESAVQREALVAAESRSGLCPVL
jgi:hypothetical protein